MTGNRETLLIVVFTLIAGSGPAGVAVAQAVDTLSPEDMREELTEFITLQQSYLEQYELISGPNERLETNLQKEISRVALMPTETLSALAKAPIDLRALNYELGNLLGIIDSQIADETALVDSYPKTANVIQASPPNGFDAQDTAGAPRLADCPANGAVTSDADRTTLPPGYCGQSDDIPVYSSYPASPANSVSTTFKLSDTGYHRLCPRNTPAGVLYAVDLAFHAINGANHVLGKACQQEAAGFNSSTACTWIAPAMGLIMTILEDVGKCNGERRDAERNTTYARAGEVYVQSQAHYDALSSANFLISNAVKRLDTNISGKLVRTGNEVSDDLDQGFEGLGNQTDAIEKQIRENALKTDAIRQNNQIIEYKIWCDKQRPDLRPSNCP